MNKIPIGNTLQVRWRVKHNGQAESLEGLDLSLVMTTPSGQKQAMAFAVSDTNLVTVNYEGKDQQHLGNYRLDLFENRGENNQRRIDSTPAFVLVAHTAEAHRESDPNLEVYTVDLTGDIEIDYPSTAVLFTPQELTAGQQAQARENINAKKGGYTRIEKIHDYVHEIWYDGADYSFAPLLPHSPLGCCTSIRHGKFFARNLDWQYSECCEFFVHTPAVNGRHAVDGFGGNIPALTKSVVESGEWNAAYNWLPLSIADGHNDAGLCASMNVVPTKTAPNTYERTTGTNPTKPTLNGLMIVRYILDNHTDALHAAEDIRDNWNVVMPHTDTFDEELHFLIADKTQTIVLEFVGNEAVIIQKPDQEGYITNFRLNGVEYNEYDDLVIDTIEPFGQGVERWEEIYNGISEYLTIENLLNDLKILYFTHAYNDDRQYYRRTDFAGLHDELTVQAAFDTPSVYDATLSAAHQAYLDRTRDGQTWQTTHSVVYDIETGECLFRTQQDESTATRRDMVLPIDAYTKAETDALLEDKVDKVTGKGLSTNDYDNSEKSKLAGSLSDIAGESTELPSGDTTMSIVYFKNDGEKGKVSLPLITPDNYGQNAYGIMRGEDFGKFNEKAEKTFIAVYGVTPYNDVKAAYEAGKTIICQHSGIYEPLVSASANTFTFCTLLNKMRFMSYLSANGWVEIDAETLATAAALASKQDTISDLESIRSGASAGATALQPADIAAWAKQPTKPTYTASEVGALPSSTDYIKDAAVSQDGNTLTLTKNDGTQVHFAPSGGGVQGVISQTQTWAADYSGYTMSSIVRGTIPQANIDLFVNAGALFNQVTGYFELNGLTDISYNEMLDIYRETGHLNNYNILAMKYSGTTIRTTFPLFANNKTNHGGIAVPKYDLSGAFNFAQCEVVYYLNNNTLAKYRQIQYFYNAFNSCHKLKKIIGAISLRNTTEIEKAFLLCESLEDVQLMCVSKNISFANSSKLSNSSILYLLNNVEGNPTFSITVHADVYDRTEEDADIQTALEEHPTITIISA